MLNGKGKRIVHDRETKNGYLVLRKNGLPQMANGEVFRFDIALCENQGHNQPGNTLKISRDSLIVL